MGRAWSGRSAEADGPPVDGAPGRGAWAPRAPQGLLQPGLPQPVCALGLGVFPALGSGSPGREGSTGLSA